MNTATTTIVTNSQKQSIAYLGSSTNATISKALSPTPNTFSSDLNRAKNKTTRKQQQPSATESVQTLKSITSNKGNNKITELRTILQRESQNS